MRMNNVLVGWIIDWRIMKSIIKKKKKNRIGRNQFKKAERFAYGFVSSRSCIRDCTSGMSEALSNYYKHHSTVKNGQHGPTPCFGIIQRNRRDALCFKRYIILFKTGAIIETHDWHRISGKGSLCQVIDTLVKVWVSVLWFPQVSLFPYCTVHCSL